MSSVSQKKDTWIEIVLLDMQMAFGTFDHGILSMKVEALGLSQDAVRYRLLVS